MLAVKLLRVKKFEEPGSRRAEEIKKIELSADPEKFHKLPAGCNAVSEKIAAIKDSYEFMGTEGLP